MNHTVRLVSIMNTIARKRDSLYTDEIYIFQRVAVDLNVHSDDLERKGSAWLFEKIIFLFKFSIQYIFFLIRSKYRKFYLDLNEPISEQKIIYVLRPQTAAGNGRIKLNWSNRSGIDRKTRTNHTRWKTFE